jgi:prolyl-tRNA editing enzyme YbaK/EbsC (Cys-tRNA(Pro) deacylase)
MPLKQSAQRVQDALSARGFANVVIELPASARSAAEAAAAVGCAVEQIAKSLVFRAAGSGRAVLAVASGGHRVDEALLAAVVGEPLERATPDFVRAETGYAIGGVPPLGHDRPLFTVVDEALLAHARIWAAAGHPQAVFSLAPAELVALTGGRVARLA